ncbi:MAG: type II secretion system secretin GspD [Betaproteobacteria bacterium]|nr:type II secretion system secretin GspD [Betaproteobacteria bacterium]
MLAAACLYAPGARPADEPVTLNFVNADIESVAAAIGKMTNRNFLIDPRVKGTVNIVSARPVPAAAVYGIFLSALRLQGFAAVESGGVTKILLEADAKLHAGTAPARGVAGGDRLQTQVYTLKYTSANQLMPVLRPIISPNNTIAAFAGNNSLVITDYGENLRRIERIIEAIDRPGGGEAVVLPLHYAAAADVVQTLNRVLSDSVIATAGQAGAVDPSTRVYLAADARTNSIVVRSENPARVAHVQALVGQLDVQTGTAANVHVVYLKNAEAVRLAQTLRGVLSGDAGPAPAPAAPLGGAPAGAGQAAPAGQGGGMVQADPASNALLVSAPDAMFAHIKAIIDKLDVRRAQVYVEALIVEITADKAAEFGIQWQSLGDLSSTQSRVIGGTNFGGTGSGANIIDAAVNLGALGPGLNIGVVKGQVTIPGIGTVTNLSALARALETDANANILSTPNLLTLDNEEARIVIGQNVPFITGQYAQTGSATTATPFQTIERRDVGLTLRVKPQVSEGGTVRLQIFQEISSVADQTNAAGVITKKRAIESTVLVDDGQIVALGGLMQDSVSTGMEKVPLLGDIPLLGLLFRYETRKQSKTNLMVFLRPVVLRDSASYGSVTAGRYKELLGEQEKSQMPSHPVLPDYPAPLLPPPPVQPDEPAPPPANPAPPDQTAPKPPPPLSYWPAIVW